MPGLHVVHDRSGGLDDARVGIDGALRALLHEDGFTAGVLHATDRIVVARSVHPAYPVETFRAGPFVIFLEGILYGSDRPATAAKLERLAAIVFDPADRSAEAAGWLLETDGDFVVCVVDEASSEARIVTDALGRLPLYIAGDGGRTIVSRELGFITALSGRPRLDATAVPQYLLLGYPLGGRTLIDGVRRSPPASVIRCGSGSCVPPSRVHRFDLDERDRSTGDVDREAEECAALFVGACRRRAGAAGANVLTLSGGLDSRAVAAGLRAAGIPFAAATFLDSRGTAAADIEPARRIARAHGLDWRLFTLGPATGGDALTLLRTKGGMNHLGMSFSIPYFRMIREAWGPRITYFTGDGGDKTLPDLSPLPAPRSTGDLVGRILDRQAVIPAGTVSALTGVETGTLERAIEETIGSYPETGLSARYGHFLIFERAYSWLFEGEDRNRFFFWTAAPFYAIDLFTWALRRPDRLKRSHRLYRAFLRSLSPETAGIANPAWRLPVSSPIVPLLFLARRLHGILPPSLRSAVRAGWNGRSRGRGAADGAAGCMREQIERCPAIGDLLSIDAVEIAAGTMSATGLDHLFTITSLIEYLRCGGSALERRRDEGLI